MKAILQNWHAVVASQLPGLLLTSLYLPSIPPPVRRVLVLQVVAALLAVLLLSGVAREARTVQARAMQITIFVLLTLAYPLVATLCNVPRESRSDSIAASLYAVATVAILWFIGRVNREDLLAARPMANIVVCGLAGVILADVCSHAIKTAGRSWRPVVMSLCRPALLGRSMPDDPDILHIVLDGLTSAEALKTDFNADIAAEIARLRALGLHVESGAVANYPQTYPALASALNGVYLDPLMPVLTGTASKTPLNELIQRSAVIGALKSRGYEFTFIGSSYSAARSHAQADRCACGGMPMGEFEQALLAITPARGLPTWTTPYEYHRREVLQEFDDIAAVPSSTRARLVIAHILAPHPPFVFGSDGAPVTPGRSYGMDDGSSFRGSREEYRRGYGAQVRFVLDRLTRAVSAFLRSSRRGVVIMIHGDHGSGLDYDENSISWPNGADRLSIFLGYRISAASRPEVDEVGSPVNLYRAVFAERFGIHLPRLPTRSYLVRFERPYDFTQVAGSHPRAAAERR